MKNTYIHKVSSFFLSGVMMIGAFGSSLGLFAVQTTSAAASPWDLQKATHLAYRGLISPTQQNIDELLSAGSADAAVEKLFEAPTAAETAEYENILDEYFYDANMLNLSQVREGYVVQRWKNPEQAKEKLFLLFEDILTVDISKPAGSGFPTAYIHFLDWQNTIYQSLDGSYKELVKRTMREFAQAYYLNVLNGNKESPNQDFAREYLQLFLMEERGPFETDVTVRNYTEQEMINMSFLVTGYRYLSGLYLPDSIKNRSNDDRYISFTKLDGTDSVVWFDRAYHNTTPRELFGELVSTPVGQDPAEIVTEYVFDKKEDAIADFIGWKLVNHYVNTTPTPSEVAVAAQILKDNNFHLINSAKALLKHDIMYSSESMNELRYKNPVELVVGMLKKFNPDFNITQLYNDQLPYLDFNAIGAPSIFGRNGMDQNDLWMDGSKFGSWVSFIAYTLPQTLLSRSGAIDKNSLKKASGESDSAYISRLWNFINVGKNLPSGTQSYFETMSSTITGGSMTDAQLYTIMGDMFSQPEYLLLSGENIAPQNNAGSVFPNDHVVIYNWMAGAPDIHHLFPPVHDKNYELIKGKMALTAGYMTDLVDKNGTVNPLYKANKYAFGEKMLNYFRTGELTIIQGAAQIGQSQSHYAARSQTETGTIGAGTGYLTRVFQENPVPATQIQMRAFSQLANGTAATFIPNSTVTTGISTAPSKDLTDIFTERKNSNTLPGKLNLFLPNALDIASLVQTKGINLGTMQGRFDYFLELVESKDALVMTNATGGFDSHRDQAPYLVGRTANGSTRVEGKMGVENAFRASMDLYAETFEKFKTDFPNKKLTIVLYGEFGRTTVPNATLGTDHGRGGLFMILTTDDTLMKDSSGNNLPSMIGRLNTNDNQLNFQDVKVDKRSIWNHLFTKIYNTDIFTSAGEETPLPLETYVKMDELYDMLDATRNLDETQKSAALAKVEELKTELSQNTFATEFFLGRLEEINNHFARTLSLPANHEHLFSSFSFENNIGDASYHSQQLKPTGEFAIDYANGVSGKALLIEPGEQFDNDKYDVYTKELAKNTDISEQGNSIFFWISPKTLGSTETVIFENLAKGGRVSLSNIGTDGGKKLKIDYMSGTSATSVLSPSSADSPNVEIGEWVHIGLVSDTAAKKFRVYINGKEVINKTLTLADNYKYRFGSTNISGTQHSVLVDEFTSYGKAYTPEEAQLKYAKDALKNSANANIIKDFIAEIPSDNTLKSQFDALQENIERPSHPDLGTFLGSKPIYESVNKCLESGANHTIDGVIKLQWKGENLFINEGFFRQSIDPLFLEGVKNGSIDFTYDKAIRTYTFHFNGNDEELWNCYFETAPFFVKFFTIVE